MISEKAQELGRLIGQSNEYQALRRAEQDLRGDADTQLKLDKISTLAKQVDTVIAQGQMPDEATRWSTRPRSAISRPAASASATSWRAPISRS